MPVPTEAGFYWARYKHDKVTYNAIAHVTGEAPLLQVDLHSTDVSRGCQRFCNYLKYVTFGERIAEPTEGIVTL